MKKLAALLLSAPLFAQTAGTTYFRAILLPSNEVPALNNASRGIADIIASAVRDASGEIVSGTVDVLVRTTLPAANTATGVSLHNAIGSQIAPVALGTGISASNPRPLQSGADFLHIPIQVVTPLAVAALRSLVDDPTRFYLNLTTADQPAGLMRGQLQRTQSVVLMGILDSASVTTAPAGGGTGFAQIVAIGTRDAAGNWTSGEVYTWTSTTSTDPTAFNGCHIHTGPAGTAGAIGITATLPPGAIPDPFGDSQIGPLYTEIAVTNATQANAFTNLFLNPEVLYLDLHTVQNPNGIVRAQLRRTDRATLPVMLGAMQVNLTVFTLRKEDGSVASGTVLCDLNLRLPGTAQVLGLWLHDGGPNDEGPVSLKLTPDFYVESGFGNYHAWTPPILQLDALQDLLNKPESHYLNLHTFDGPAGVARAQVAAPSPRAEVTAMIQANLDKAATTIVGGGLATIFGTALAKIPADLSGWAGAQLPLSLNGARVFIAGTPAPLIYGAPGQMNVQVPLDVPAGVQTVTVDNGGGAGAAYSVTVGAAAPAIFFSPVAAVLKNSNFSLVSAANPARSGDVLLVYATGLGQTTPALATGALVPATSLCNTRPVTATIGGRSSAVSYSVASPGFTGLYQIAVTVPAGVSGTVPLQIQMGSAASNTVTIPVQ